MNLRQRIRFAIDAPRIEDDMLALKRRVEVQSRTLARVRKARDNARTFAEAAKREGLIPAGAWQRYVNCMTDSESEGDIQRDIDAAEALRQRLNRDDSALSAARKATS